MDGHFANVSVARTSAPSADAPYEVRASWARDAVEEVVQSGHRHNARVLLPPDIRPTHFWEIEFQSALTDPQAYARTLPQPIDRASKRRAG